jgi:hypothetical protein
MTIRHGRRDLAKATLGGAFAVMGFAGEAAGQQVPLQAPALRSGPSTDAVRALVREAYLYAYPLVSMETTMRQATNVPDARTANMRAPLNQFAHARAYPRAEERDVVRFNFDTLYSFAWLDLSGGPIVVTAPDTAGRHFLLPMLDMWTNVFMTVGTRTVGNGGGHWAVVPPGWTGRLPEGVGRIDAPTPVVWILGRTQTNGVADYANVHRVQDGYRLTPLAGWGREAAPPAAGRVDPAVDNRTPPLVQVDRMDGVAMLTRLAALMGRHPPQVTDQPIVTRMRRGLGLEAGRPFDPDRLGPGARETINRAAKDALDGMQPAFERTVRAVNGWFLTIDNMGTYGTSYLRRAIVATGGLGANLPEDAVYPTATFDAEGRPLSGENRYVLRFEPGRLPPADAFWSLTMYDMDGFQVPNPLDRFALGDRDRLAFGPDGSLEIHVQADNPGGAREGNWLPAPRARFQPNLRLYSPRAEVLDGSWAPPPIRRVG